MTLAIIALCSLWAPIDFDATFTGATCRVDYHHGGTATEERIGLDRVRIEGPWAGSRTQLLDPLDRGKYLFVVRDRATNRPLYSRGFASIYGEWETTGEVKRQWRTFHESVRFPEPRAPVQLVLEKRRADGLFSEVFTCLVDPAGRQTDRSPVTSAMVTDIHHSGDPATKVDLLLLGDGYTAAEADRFVADAKRLTAALFAAEPFKSRAADFNVRAIMAPAPRSGITNPRAAFWNRTPLGLSFNAFDSDRYVLSYENQAIRELAAAAPHDAIVLVANTRKYGGGGIFNLWSTCAAGSGQAAYLFVHEFGHSFAGLADEYYTSQVSYEELTPAGVEPWEPNITALLEPARLKWHDLVSDGTPLPTPWHQDEFDAASLAYQKKRTAMRERQASEEEMERLFAEIKTTTEPMLAANEHAGRVGAFAGAGYRAKGLYRPELDCIMFTRNPDRFCRVCSRAIEAVIDVHTR